MTSLGSAIFAFLAAGVFKTIEEAQQKLCPSFRTIEPDASEATTYEQLFPLYRKLYFALGRPGSEPVPTGEVLPELRRIAGQR